MRELQQHYQQRLVTLNESNQNRDQDKLVIESFKKENEGKKLTHNASILQ